MAIASLSIATFANSADAKQLTPVPINPSMQYTPRPLLSDQWFDIQEAYQTGLSPFAFCVGNSLNGGRALKIRMDGLLYQYE